MTGPTDDRRTLHEAIGSVASTGGTAILDSLAELSNRLAKVDGRRAIVLITDGYDEHSTLSLTTRSQRRRRPAPRSTSLASAVSRRVVQRREESYVASPPRLAPGVLSRRPTTNSNSFAERSQTTCVIGHVCLYAEQSEDGRFVARSRCGVRRPSMPSARGRGISPRSRARSNRRSSSPPGTRWALSRRCRGSGGRGKRCPRNV